MINNKNNDIKMSIYEGGFFLFFDNVKIRISVFVTKFLDKF